MDPGSMRMTQKLNQSTVYVGSKVEPNKLSYWKFLLQKALKQMVTFFVIKGHVSGFSACHYKIIKLTIQNITPPLLFAKSFGMYLNGNAEVFNINVEKLPAPST